MPRAKERLRKLAAMPFCREHNAGKQAIRPCVMRRPAKKPSALEDGIFTGSVTRQRGFCGEMLEPYYCNLTSVQRWQARRLAVDALDVDCTCRTDTRAMRSSAYSRCHRELRIRIGA